MDSDIFTCIGCGLQSYIVKEQICGHVYCERCISTAEAKGISVCSLEHLPEKKKKKKLATETKKKVEENCYFCNSKLDSDNIKSHYDVCDLFPVDSPNNCNKKCLRAQINIHMQECPENLHTCPFLPLGCNFKGSPADITKHEEDKIHLKLMLNVLLKTEQTNATKMTDNVSSTEVMKIVQDDLQKQIEKQNLEIDWCRKRIFELEQHDWCKKKILELEQQFDLEQSKNSSDLAEVFKKLQDLTVKNIIMEQSQDKTTSNIRKVNEKLEEMKKKEKNENNIINEQLANLKTSYAEDKKILSDEIGGVAESLNIKQDEYAKQFGTLEEMIIQQGEKITALRSNSFNFIWRIDNFNTSDYVGSDPFYSDKFGYKMRLVMFCQGVGIGKGTHSSVSLGFIKGENDEILDWPVRFTAELSLLDQSKQKKHHSLTFNTDEIEGVKHNTVQTVRSAWAFPTFISLDELKRYYLVNNTIFLKANITFTK